VPRGSAVGLDPPPARRSTAMCASSPGTRQLPRHGAGRGRASHVADSLAALEVVRAGPRDPPRPGQRGGFPGLHWQPLPGARALGNPWRRGRVPRAARHAVGLADRVSAAHSTGGIAEATDRPPAGTSSRRAVGPRRLVGCPCPTRDRGRLVTWKRGDQGGLAAGSRAAAALGGSALLEFTAFRMPRASWDAHRGRKDRPRLPGIRATRQPETWALVTVDAATLAGAQMQSCRHPREPSGTRRGRCRPVDAIWHLGDVVGHGPDPDAVVERLRAVGATGVKGNRCGRREEPNQWFNPDARRPWVDARHGLAGNKLIGGRAERSGRRLRRPEPARADLGVRDVRAGRADDLGYSDGSASTAIRISRSPSSGRTAGSGREPGRRLNSKLRGGGRSWIQQRRAAARRRPQAPFSSSTPPPASAGAPGIIAGVSPRCARGALPRSPRD
jgi:hypothetical protein